MYEYFDHRDPNVLSGTVVGSSVRSTNYLGPATMANSTNHNHEDNLKLSNFYLHGLSDNSKQEFNCQLMGEVFKEQEQSLERSNWGNGVHEMKEITLPNTSHHQYHQEQIEKNQNHIAIIPQSPFSTDFLNLLQMNHHNAEKITNYQPSLDIFGEICINENGIGLYDPQSHLNFSSQSSMFRDLYDASPSQNYGLTGSKDGSNLFVGKDDQEILGDIFQEDNTGRGKTPVNERKQRGHFATERQRREQLNEKYSLLKSLVPNPTKSDRASIVGDAINYIKELQRTVEELKTLADQKRYGKQKKRKIEDGVADMESSSMKPTGALLRCSWLERKSKETVVDVRIVHDEVNMKLTQRKRTNCLLYVSKILHELQLELVHLAGGNIGDSYIFMFNTKICEGSSLYAGAIAKKVLEAADRQNSTMTTSL